MLFNGTDDSVSSRTFVNVVFWDHSGEGLHTNVQEILLVPPLVIA